MNKNFKKYSAYYLGSLLERKKIDVLIIFAWNYADIIIKKNKKFQKKGGKFLIPFPKPKLL